MQYLYLLHYTYHHGHVQHVLFYTDNLNYALIADECGTSHGICAAMSKRGIRFRVAWVKEVEDGSAARREIRRSHNNRRYCPYCNYGRWRQLPLGV